MKLAGQKVELLVVCGGLAKNKLYIQTHADVLGSYLQSVPCTDYLHQGGYVIIVVCLSVSNCTKTSKRICMKFSGKVGNGPVNK